MNNKEKLKIYKETGLWPYYDRNTKGWKVSWSENGHYYSFYIDINDINKTLKDFNFNKEACVNYFKDSILY